MKRLSVWWVLILLCTFSIFAQNKVITVSGRVVESDSKEPAAQATIQLLSLPDSAYAAGIASSNKGWFTLPKVKAGKYLLKVSYIGFRTKFVPVQLFNNVTEKKMGTISLDPDAVMLSEAVITAEAPPVTVKADTTEYSAAAYPVPEGSMLEDLVKKIPGAEVSDEGKITINGKEIKKIMVDGKEFFSDDPKVSMKNLPANMIEKVKAYDKKSDMARITGIDDGDEEPVLDLTVKKGMKKGWIGNLIAGYGSQDRYEGGVMISRFKDDASLSIIGSANNTNNKGFSEFGDAGQGLVEVMLVQVLQLHNRWESTSLRILKSCRSGGMYNMDILIMTLVAKPLQKHSWGKHLLLLKVRTFQIVIVMIFVLISVWNGDLTH